MQKNNDKRSIATNKEMNPMRKKIPKNIRDMLRPTYLKIKALSVSIQKKIYNDPNKLFVNIGGGRFFEKNWKVLDYVSPDYPYNKGYVDISFNLMDHKPLPFESNSVDLFFSSHTFEHVTTKAAQRIFNEIHRCLKKGGGVRIVLPDIDCAYRAFINNDKAFFDRISPTRKDMTILKCFLLWFNPEYLLYDLFEVLYDAKLFDPNITEKMDMFIKTNAFSQRIIDRNPATQHDHAKHHVTWYNFDKATRMLKKAGFEYIDRSSPQMSYFREMSGKEFDEKEKVSFFIEAVK